MKQLIAAAGGKLRLRAGDGLYVEHGRSLVILFAGGQDLGLELIREGLAVLAAVPPDLEQLPCYQDAEAAARNQHRGIWSQASPLVT